MLAECLLAFSSTRFDALHFTSLRHDRVAQLEIFLVVVKEGDVKFTVKLTPSGRTAKLVENLEGSRPEA
jgi:hypothetical protein